MMHQPQAGRTAFNADGEKFFVFDWSGQPLSFYEENGLLERAMNDPDFHKPVLVNSETKEATWALDDDHASRVLAEHSLEKFRERMLGCECPNWKRHRKTCDEYVPPPQPLKWHHLSEGTQRLFEIKVDAGNTNREISNSLQLSMRNVNKWVKYYESRKSMRAENEALKDVRVDNTLPCGCKPWRAQKKKHLRACRTRPRGFLLPGF